jgi:hypothetical protein
VFNEPKDGMGCVEQSKKRLSGFTRCSVLAEQSTKAIASPPSSACYDSTVKFKSDENPYSTTKDYYTELANEGQLH